MLAFLDLMVGVSNDAVNFLNSAIGARVAPTAVILGVATVGILVGASFSAGMMEVARKGIFNPDSFFFAEIMIVFLAVMLVDIILLDLFNSLGMPTSTTVSIVFELLGAAVAVAAWKLGTSGESLALLNQYINTDRAIAIISAIFMSVAIAFVVGAVVQYVARLIFTFETKRQSAITSVIWCSLALAILAYFLFVKGIGGSVFASPELTLLIQKQRFLVLAGFFGIAMMVVLFVKLVLKWDPFKLVVLAGTFSLAMAFASNDLVNFIGVPVAAFQSFQFWRASGVPADEFAMGALAQPVAGSLPFLIAAGVTMAATLWFSRKARSVTQTEIDLARQDNGHERFQPNWLSRGVVAIGVGIGNLLTALVPQRWRAINEARFAKGEPDTPIKADQPSFDLVRASVNLTVASMLIAIATSLKLPLSTTYVSFMVAMGTSMSDRAWGKDSAAYRVSGVLSVIGGWLLTAALAFAAAAIAATIMWWLGAAGVFLMVAVAAFAVYHSSGVHKRTVEKQKGPGSVNQPVAQP